MYHFSLYVHAHARTHALMHAYTPMNIYSK